MIVVHHLEKLALAAHPLAARGTGRALRDQALQARSQDDARAGGARRPSLGKSPVVTDGDRTVTGIRARSSNIYRDLRERDVSSRRQNRPTGCAIATTCISRRAPMSAPLLMKLVFHACRQRQPWCDPGARPITGARCTRCNRNSTRSENFSSELASRELVRRATIWQRPTSR